MREIKDLKQWYLSVVIAVILWGFFKALILEGNWGVNFELFSAFIF